MNKNNDFDIQAKDYDKSKKRKTSIALIANKIKEKINFSKQMKVLDFGAGTGLLTMELYNSVDKVVAVDNSQKMLDVLEDKIKENKVRNVDILCGDIEKTEIKEKFDVIISSLTFHHLKNVEYVINKLYHLLSDGGIIVIVDFKNELLTKNILDAGFKLLQVEEIDKYKKMLHGSEKELTVVLMTAKK